MNRLHARDVTAVARRLRVFPADGEALLNSAEEQRRIAADNKVVTSRYNAVTFIPRALFEQFRRVANLYFLVMGIIMVVGTYTDYFQSSVEPLSCLIPLAIVLGFSMAKEGYEDFHRHVTDRVVNNRLVRVVKPDGTVLETACKDLRVGDVILVRGDEEVPADMVLLACAERGTSSARQSAVGYVETSSIDGESNLKVKIPMTWTLPKERYEEVEWQVNAHRVTNVAQFHGDLECEPASKAIHSFSGSIDFSLLDRPQPLSIKNFLLRGSVLRCTGWALGILVYTGRDTKIALNARTPPSKLSFVDKIVNGLLWIVLSMMLAVCTISTVLSLVWREANDDAKYLCLHKHDLDDRFEDGCSSGDTASALMFFTFATLYNNFVCISMYITLEIVYYIQAYYISNDIEMYDPKTDTPAEARTSNMNSDLGQVQYIFTDKTGTLTKNSMRVRRCSVGGVVFGAPLSADPEPEQDGDNDPSRRSDMSSFSTMQFAHPDYAWAALGRLRDSLLSSVTKPEQHALFHSFLLNMALCNTVVLTSPQDYTQTAPVDELLSARFTAEFFDVDLRSSALNVTDLKEFIQAESADEAALVLAAANDGGVILCNRTPTEAILLNNGVFERYRLLAVNEFDSDRKRMSIVVRDQTGRLLLLCKGADSSMFPRAHNDNLALATKEHVGLFANNGLRTLVLSQRVLTEEEFQQWLPVYNKAVSTVENRAELLRKAADLIETKLQILGCVGIEDELQDDVVNSINTLREAGIHIWMLTGDKAETAISVGHACGLVPQGADIERVLGMTDPVELGNRLQDLAALSGGAWKRENIHHCVIVDGDSIGTAQTTEDLNRKFVRAMRDVPVVIACRVSPLQKASLVRMIKKRKDEPVTLAIGDGANDIGMLHEAQIGVGISGKEGRHAANNADFAIAEFRMLVRLLLLHGRTDYIRSSKVVLYSFYKNLVLVSLLFLYCSYNGWSGTALLESMVYSGYNFYLALPIIAVGVFDRDVPYWVCVKHPGLAYATGLKRQYLNFQTMARWTITAFVQGLVLYGMGIRAVAQFSPSGPVAEDGSPSGQVGGLYADGFMMYTALIFAMQIKVAKMTRTWTVWNVVVWLLSFAGYFAFCYIYALFPEIDQWFMVPHFAGQHSTFWLSVFFIAVTLNIFDFVIEELTAIWFPTADKVLVAETSDFSGEFAAEPKTLRGTRSWQMPSVASTGCQNLNIAVDSRDYSVEFDKTDLKRSLLA